MKKDTIPEEERAMFPVDPRILAAAVEGARLATLAASRANATSQLAMALPPPGALGAPVLPQGVYREEEAFASVHDLVHYAIIASPAQRASLRQVYHVCETQGRIAHKHGGGSRHLICNEHWKSQIRHALYTSPRFTRTEDNEDDWCMVNKSAPAPVTTTVRVYPADEPPASASEKKTRGRPRKRKSESLGVESQGVDKHKRSQRSNSSQSSMMPPPPPPSQATTVDEDEWEGQPLGLKTSPPLMTSPPPVIAPAAVTANDENVTTTASPFASPNESPIKSPTRKPLSPANTAKSDGSLDMTLSASEASPRAVTKKSTPTLPQLSWIAKSSPTESPTETVAAKKQSLKKPVCPKESHKETLSPTKPSPTCPIRTSLPSGPVLVMVGDKQVKPAARDKTQNRRKPRTGRRAALPIGVTEEVPLKIPRRKSNTLSRLWEEV